MARCCRSNRCGGTDKNFGIMKFECIFASEERQTSTYKAKAIGHFLCSFDSVVDASILPSVSLSETLSLCDSVGSLATSEKRTASFVFIHNSNFVQMTPNFHEICEGAKQSTTSTRRSGAKSASRVSRNQGTDQSLEQLLTELAETFEAEKNAKNEAYYFILSNGLLDQFADFCRNYRSRDPHKDCVEYLLSKC